jgi:hypothetical protein
MLFNYGTGCVWLSHRVFLIYAWNMYFLWCPYLFPLLVEMRHNLLIAVLVIDHLCDCKHMKLFILDLVKWNIIYGWKKSCLVHQNLWYRWFMFCLSFIFDFSGNLQLHKDYYWQKSINLVHLFWNIASGLTDRGLIYLRRRCKLFWYVFV